MPEVIPEQCPKCGDKLVIGPFGLIDRDSVRKLADSHAATKGCDWPSQNIEKALELFKKKGK